MENNQQSLPFFYLTALIFALPSHEETRPTHKSVIKSHQLFYNHE